MTLGWLSRLGIVLTAFGMPITATYLTNRSILDAQEVQTNAREMCLKAARQIFGENSSDYSREYQLCWKEWPVGFNSPLGPIWKESFIVAAVLFGIAWIIGLAIYWSVIWILAGRNAKLPPE